MQSYKLVRNCEKEWELEVPIVLTRKEVEIVIAFLTDKGCSELRTTSMDNGTTITSVLGCKVTKSTSTCITKYTQTSKICPCKSI